jgi:flagellar protein FliO/FliZ
MDFNQFLISVSIVLFVVAFVALAIWAFKAFVLGGGSGRSGSAFLRQRDRRLGLVESTAIDGRRRLLLVRRDDLEHLIMIGGPVDMLIEAGIQGRRHLEPPLEDVIIARSDTRPAPKS